MDAKDLYLETFPEPFAIKRVEFEGQIVSNDQRNERFLKPIERHH